MKKILFVDPSPFPYYSGGVETWLFNLINEICGEYSITVISPKASKGRKKVHELGDRIQYVHYKVIDNNIFFRNRLVILSQYYKILKLSSALRAYLKKNESTETTVVCLDTVICGKAINTLRNEGYSFNYVVSIRGPHSAILSKSYPFFKALYEKWESETLRIGDTILANGEDTKHIYQEKISQPIHIMKNGVSIKRLLGGSACNVNDVYKKDGEFIVLSVATLIRIKGVYKIVKAIHEYILQYGTNIRVVFVGKGDQEALLSYAANLGVDSYVSCVGEKKNVEDYYAVADIIVCASGGSGLSMSMLEALASKKPVVAINTPVYQQFNKNNALNLVDDSAKGIADGLERVTKNYQNELRKSQINIEFAKEFDWSVVASDFVGYIKNS